MEPKLNFEVHEKEGRKRFVWSLKGLGGGVHIWAQFLSPGETSFGERFYGGVEVHHMKKPYDDSPDDAPIKDCWLTGCDCWPDGSSLYFSERLQPMIEVYEDEPEKLTSLMNGELLSWYGRHLSRSDFPAMLAEARAEWFMNLIKAADSLGYHCTGCGHICKDPDKDLTILRKTGALSCCPEREMEPLSAPILDILDQPSGDRHE